MVENARPVAVRIARPYGSEEEFLANELETIGKTSAILLGAPSHPAGTIVRFEVVLGSGAVLLRGEGRVLAYKESAFRGQAGLGLRFTRLDPRSKALVDRAAALREARAGGPPSVEKPADVSPAPIKTEAEVTAPESAPSASEPIASVEAPSPSPSASEPIASSAEPAPPPRPQTSPGIASARPQDRDALLARLRERASGLDPARVADILRAKA